MLVVALRVNETVAVGPDIEIMVTGITVAGMKLRGGQVKIGLVAPKNVRIRRGRKVTTSKRDLGRQA